MDRDSRIVNSDSWCYFRRAPPWARADSLVR